MRFLLILILVAGIAAYVAYPNLMPNEETLAVTTDSAEEEHAEDQHDDEHHDATRVQHYEGAEVNSEEEARALLAMKIEKIGEIIAKPALDDQSLEAIHEHSYSLETAIDALREYKAASVEVIDHVDEAVQAIHYASENHEEAVTREWFAKLKTSAAKLL